MPVILIYLQPFRRNLLFKCKLQPKIAKKFTKTTFYGRRGSRSFKVIDVNKSKSPYQCLLW